MVLTGLDLLVMAVPFAIVLAVAMTMRRYLRNVADYLAAGRCAGRYLICTAMAETGASVTATVVALELFSRTGFSLNLWGGFTSFIFFLLALSGVIGYRFRETRALTFHQFFEVRYSRGLRQFASFLNFFSGLFNFGMLPAVGARFFVYFCGLPPTVTIGLRELPTYGVVMVLLVGLSLFMALTGGQISLIVTDCIEGLISGVLYLVVAVAVLLLLSYSQMETALLSGPPGQSYINPLDISQQPDFNGWYVAIGLAIGLYYYRGNAWQTGFNAAARNPHEAKMAGVLTNWRIYGAASMATLVSLGAFTMLHHSDFAPQAAQVQQRLSTIGTEQLRTQMRMPVALSLLLPSGVKGAFCAIGLFGLLAGQGLSMHAFGSVFIQDVVLPFRRTPLDPRRQIRWLRMAAVGIGLFAIAFGLWFKPPEYLVLIVQLIGAIYLCVGATVWGGLYWRKGTTAGAWVSMIVGSIVAIIGLAMLNYWTTMQPWMLQVSRNLGLWSIANYLAAHAQRCPANSQTLAAVSFAFSGSLYVIVSLLTCRKDFEMDRLLHRGKYRVQDVQVLTDISQGPRSWWARLAGIDSHYTRGDKVIAGSVFFWSLLWQVVAVVVLIWNLVFWRWPDRWWCWWTFFQSVWITLALAVVTTIWFTIGGTRDLLALFRSLRTLKRDDRDDGRVVQEAATERSPVGPPAP